MVDRPRGTPVARGDRLEVEIEAFGDGPDGLATVDGYVLFVPGGIPGERTEIEVESAGRKFGRARAVEIHNPSPARVEPRCKHFHECGGCQSQHVAPEKQREAKQARVARTLGHALRDRVPSIDAMRGPTDPWGQRTKVALHFSGTAGHLQAGYFRRRSRALVPIEECPASDPLALRVALAVRDGVVNAGLTAWDPRSDRGDLRAVVVRSSPATGEAHATLVTRRPLPQSSTAPIIRCLCDCGATGLSIDVNEGDPEQLLSGETPRRLWGEWLMHDEVEGLQLRISPSAFFRTSSWGVRELVRLVRERAGVGEEARVVDLYCGVGLLGLSLAAQVERVIGVDSNEAAAADAVANAEALGLDRAVFRAAKVEYVADRLARGRRGVDLLIVDPPPIGLSRNALEAIVERVTPARLLYASCDVETLARDLKQLTSGGYQLRSLTPIDTLPHTHHIECLAVLERRRKPAGHDARLRLLNKARDTQPRQDGERPE